MSNVNENIRNYRKFRGMSQTQLGQAVNRSANVVSNWENGIHSPDIETIEDICKILNVTPNQIFGWEENPDYVNYVKNIKEYQDRIDCLHQQMLDIEKEITMYEQLKYEAAPPFDED